MTMCLVLSAFDWPLGDVSFEGFAFRGVLLPVEDESPANGISSSLLMVESNRLRTLTSISDAMRLAWKYLVTPKAWEGT